MASAKRDNEISRVSWKEGPSSGFSFQMKPHVGSFSIPLELVQYVVTCCHIEFFFAFSIENLITNSNLLTKCTQQINVISSVLGN